jgi:adenylate kinase
MSSKTDRATWVQGPAAQCHPQPVFPSRPWRLILLGAPGVGKGTQAELIADRLGACHLSTGDVFRAARCLPPDKRSAAMNEAIDYMKRGELVPDSTVLNMVRERFGCLRCEGGFLLDGFPRTVGQAEALQEMLGDLGVELDGVLNYELPIDEIVSRLGGRRTCSHCKAVYHVSTKPPKIESKCDLCGADLFQREDDRPESIKVRMEAYANSTSPLTNYFKEKDLLVSVDAHGSPDDIFQRSMTALENKNGK